MDLIGIAFLGLISGLVINYLADILPSKKQISCPICLNCNETMEWGRYLLFNRCTHCDARRSFRSYLIQFTFPVIFLASWLFPPVKIPYVLWVIFTIYFGVIFIIDMEHKVVLHLMSYIGIVISFAIGTWLHGISITLWGGVAGYGIMLSLYLLGKVFIRIVSKQEGNEGEEVALGYGDVNLAGILGLLLGWPGITAGLVFAILLGGLASLAIIIYAKLKKTYRPLAAVPYAPFLILGAAILFYL
jgi:prepilin signal peptidase PulO-like enzyme (type II secretory pathway)